MGIIEDVKRMQNEGRNEQDITLQLQNRGYGQQEAHDALAQAKIKEAVADQSGEANMHGDDAAPTSGGISMQPSLMNPAVSEEQQSPGLETQSLPSESYPAQQYAQPYTTAPADQQPYQDQSYYAAPSTDAITEIIEQMVAEKAEKIHQELIKSAESRQAFETKLEYLDERLKKIERTIDRLQLSILQKVGEYMTNVEDIKTEVIETQKSFKSLLAAAHGKQKEPE